MSDTIRNIRLGDREIILVGTAHISRESMDETVATIEAERPDRVCVEIDEGRYRSMTQTNAWESMDIVKVIKERKAFFLLANLALASFQRRMGLETGSKPGAEMLAAIATAERLGIPFSLCDRGVEITLRRAWAKSNLWNRSKLLASLVSGAVTNEKLEAADIERLKKQSELDDMMLELADYLPEVKETLIDERDRYLAARIWTSEGRRIVAVVGAGHAAGIESWLGRFGSGESSPDVAELDIVPPPSFLSKAASWLVPALIVTLVAIGFLRGGADASLANVGRWVFLNGSLAALGSALCLAHPVTIVLSFLAAPLATLNPLVAIGLFAGLCEAFMRKPRVSDFETLSEDITTIRGFYRNKVTHILLVFFFSSLGGAIGNLIGIPLLAAGAI